MMTLGFMQINTHSDGFSRYLGAKLWRYWADAPGQHQDARSFEPGKPYHLGSLSPKRNGVSGLKKPAECFERRHCLQVDRNVFGVTTRRPAVNDLNL
jgi:hypothetical protein